MMQAKGYMRRMRVVAVVVALFVLTATAAQASAAPFTKGKARKAAAVKLAKFERNHGWVAGRKLARCVKRSRQVRCVGIVRGAQKSCRLRIVIVRSQPRRARIKRIACRTRAPGSTEPGATRIRLRAHLSSAPKRDLQNPFKVTYEYSASATKVAEASEEPTEPPPGVLALYSDGILECATNVGGGVGEGECPVTYKALGEHRVTSIYTSGDESATVTEVQVIEPLPTETSLSVSYEPFAVASYLASGCEAEVCELPEGHWGNADMHIGTLRVTVHPVSPWGTLPKVNCPSGELEPKAPDGCAAVPQPVVSSYDLPVTAHADLIVTEDQVLVEGQPIAAEMQPPENVTIAGTGVNQEHPSVIEAGGRFFWGRSGDKAGYVSSSASVPLQFIPQATATIQFR